MIKNDQTARKSLKEIKAQEADAKDAVLKDRCEQLSIERFGAEKLAAWRKENGGIWFLPITDAADNIEKIGVLKPINRHILSYASTKLQDDGLYSFLEQCMRDCWLDGDTELLDDDEYFIPASMQFNKILEGKKATFLKA
jgi:hypothetical protein